MGESESMLCTDSTLDYKFGINLQFSVLSPNLDSLSSLYLYSTSTRSVPLRTQQLNLELIWGDDCRRHHAMSAFPFLTWVLIMIVRVNLSVELLRNPLQTCRFQPTLDLLGWDLGIWFWCHIWDPLVQKRNSENSWSFDPSTLLSFSRPWFPNL